MIALLLLVEEDAGWSHSRRTPEVAVGEVCRLTAARRALDEALLDEEGLVDLLDRPRVLTERRRDRAQTDGATRELIDDDAQ